MLNKDHRPAGILFLPSLLTMGLLMLLLAPIASAQSYSPVADTYVRSDRADTVYGKSTPLRVDGSPVARGYLRFRVDGIDAPVKKATLQVFTKGAIDSSGLALRPVASGAWSESTTTYRNAPAVGPWAANSGPASSGQWVSLDASSLVSGNGTVDLALTTGSSTSRSLAAREDAARSPRLVVETEEPPSTPGPRVDHRGAQVHSLWGNSSLDDARRELDMLQSAGADTVRVDLSWSSLEQNGKGQYSQWYVDKADAVIDAAAARGLKVVAAFHTTPCWASSAPDSLKQDCTGAWWDRNVQNYPPQSAPDYADAAAWVARRWGDRMAALEIWNEPNEANQSFLVSSDPAAAYVALVKAAYSPVKNARPELPVLAGATSFADRAFIQRLYSLGMKGYFDGLSIHPYNESRDPGDARSAGLEKWTFRSGVPWVREAMVANGDADKGLWLTEFGWSTCASGSSSWCVTESKQAEYVEDAFRIAREDDWSYVKAMLVYNLRNKGTATTDREAQFGLLQRDFSPKPGWEGFRNAMAR
ncbi:MAG: DNRLRE domain-containing protein [Actinomycetota bacterium]|nr:DNRLRE domain-containing protein [Actinomycetota bacterium]